MNDCIFCKIIAGEIPAEKVYEDKRIVAFLDMHPVNIGHTLVLPKAHYTNIYDTPDEEMERMSIVIKKLSIAIKKAVHADGINIEMNNEPVAGQLIFHTHIHIVPRFEGDGFQHWHGPRPYHEGEMAGTRKKIQEELR